MTPKITSKPLFRLTIPELSGGVNYRDGISQVLDNQLTDCSNVWYKNGLLRTRPAVRCTDTVTEEFIQTRFGRTNSKNRIYTKKDIIRVYGQKKYFLTAFQFEKRVELYFCALDGEFRKIAVLSDLPSEELTCNIFEHKTDIYCFCSGYYENEQTPYYIFKISIDETSEGEWYQKYRATRISDKDIYVPLVAINCSHDGYAVPLTKATKLEEYNLIGNRCKFMFNTFNKESCVKGLVSRIADSEVAAHYMEYLIPLERSDWGRIPEVLEVVVTDREGKKHTHTATECIENGQSRAVYRESKIQDDQRTIEVVCEADTAKIIFYAHEKNEKFTAYIDENSQNLKHDMLVTAPCKREKADFEKVLNMTLSSWFGGSEGGIWGGINLFLGGNTVEDDKALVCWSDFDNPLYFGKKSKAYVGDMSQRVTAFAKQGENMIVFKERQIYATHYVGSEKLIMAEDVIDGRADDVTSNEVSFPMLQVHSEIGCDCPKSIQLCRNRLVWAGSNGRIYTLISANGWSERSVFELSDMVEKKLRSHSASELMSACSADWEGNYILAVGNKLYLMDYNSYGYDNVSSYSKIDDARQRIPWWIWNLPSNSAKTDVIIAQPEALFNFEERLCFWSLVAVGKDSAAIPELFRFGGDADRLPLYDTKLLSRSVGEECEIASLVQTKLFDFGQPTLLKRVPKAELSLGANGGVPIEVEVISGGSTMSQTVFADGEGDDEENPNYFSTAQLKGNGSPSRRIGYRLSASGRILLDSLAVYYKQLG